MKIKSTDETGTATRLGGESNPIRGLQAWAATGGAWGQKARALWVGLCTLVAAALPLAPAAQASTAYGTLNNFDCVNDTGSEAHGFEIELDDLHSTDITYTYDYNHYGIPKISEDTFPDPATGAPRPRVFIRYAATKDASGVWSAYTAIPAGPISPTDGHQFTNPSINFGGEHFGAGYYGAPSAVKYNWLIDDGSGNLVHGPPVYVSTPTFTYIAPAPLQAPQVQAAIVMPPPPAPPVRQFGEAVWVKDIKTTTHNANHVELVDLRDPDPAGGKDWRNGEPDQVETEWRLLQTEKGNPDNPKGVLNGLPQDLPGGNEIITRRYEFYKYTGPVDVDTGEAMADAVAADGIHGVGSATFATSFDNATGEWVVETVQFSPLEIVGEFFGAQMSGFDVAPVLGLIDHIADGELYVPYASRTVVVAGGAAFFCQLSSGSLPDGTVLDEITGQFSGTPTRSGVFNFTVDAWDTTGAFVSKAYTVTIPGAAAATSSIVTSASPVEAGQTTGGGVYDDGTSVSVAAISNAGYTFVNWTEGGISVSDTAIYPFTVNGSRTLVANFVRTTSTVATSASPSIGGTTSGGGSFANGSNVTVSATPSAGYAFVNWTESGTPVSGSANYSFTLAGNRSLVANFVLITYTVTTSASPSVGGTTGGGGTFNSGSSVTVSATPSAGYVFVNWTEGGTPVSASASYNFLLGANRSLVANFTRITYTVTTSASPSVGGTTSGGGIFNSGSSVTVLATPNAGYTFVNWTENGVQVSTSSSYSFTLTGNRSLVANFAAPVLKITSTTATKKSGKLYISVTIGNSGTVTAQSVTIVSSSDATLDGKATSTPVPVALGNIATGKTATTSLAFGSVTTGTHTLQLKLTYSGRSVILSTPVVAP